MKQCLNCQAELHGPYCHHCGQKGSTHRYSIKSLLTHDLLHSVWHVDKSILRSWWQVLKAPGKEGHKNIAGKRAGQFPILTLAIFATILILLALEFQAPEDHMIVKFGKFDFTEWVHHNAKWLWLSMILFLALSDSVYFRRLRYNLAEHIVLTTYYYVGFVTVLTLALVLFRLTPNNWEWMDWITPAVCLFYIIYAYRQGFKAGYSIVGWLWRFLFSWLSFIGILLVAISILTLSLNANYGKAHLQIQYGTEAADSAAPAPAH